MKSSLLSAPASSSRFDDSHILLWLIKDTCWMLEWRVLGTIMIAPTIAVAILLAMRSRGQRAFWINLAICFWITANAYWMVTEFVGVDEYKDFAGIPFACGLISVAVFYLKRQTHSAPAGEAAAG
jgi:hypothetical protein